MLASILGPRFLFQFNDLTFERFNVFGYGSAALWSPYSFDENYFQSCACIIEFIYYPTSMIRKSHSWSLTWTRDKSADQSGPFIVSLPSGQSQSGPQVHNAGASGTSHFRPRISYLSRGVRIPFALPLPEIRVRSCPFVVSLSKSALRTPHPEMARTSSGRQSLRRHVACFIRVHPCPSVVGQSALRNSM